jgi:AraC-like DNA-binding protein
MTVDLAPEAGGQSYRERLPARALAGHVASVWVQRIAADGAPYTHRTVPNGSIEVAVEIGSAPKVIGPRTRAVMETLAPGSTVVGVRFRPGAAPAVLGLPASELVDRTVEWDELRSSPGGRVAEAIGDARSPEHAAALLERAVFDLLPEAADPDPVVARAAQELLPWRTTDVRSLQAALFVSERQLRRRILAGIGVAPKVLQRVLRFQAFLALAHQGTDLAALAAEVRYADQSHLTRESMRLAGTTPRRLLREAAEHCAGVHDHTPSWLPLLRARARAPLAPQPSQG